LRNPKDQRPSLTSRSARVYKIPYSCGKVYIGEIGRMWVINVRMNEHQRDIRLKRITQSILSEHNIEIGHQILFIKQLQ